MQLAGTFWFNVSTFSAMGSDLSADQEFTLVWERNAMGCVAFLVASVLVFAEVCHGRTCLKRRSLSWWVAVINVAG